MFHRGVYLPIICYHYYYHKSFLVYKPLSFLVRIALNCALREKYIQERIIWLIKYMNKRSYMSNICFFLHCSQLASNCGIKGVFVLHSLYNLDAVLRHCHDA